MPTVPGPAPAAAPGGGDAERRVAGVRARDGARQALTLVHFSAQPEPFLTQNTP